MTIMLADFFRNVRLADLLDVLLVSVLIYITISWLRSGASRTVVVIIVGAVILFVTANALNMYVTQALLEALFAVFVVTFVVLFQGEIRRELDRLAAYGLRWRNRAQSDVPEAFEVIAHVASRLARERVGALIVIRGREAMDHAIDGGVPLSGAISEPLLCSLFNPDSPGHDGAVIVESGRITRFSAHLPLSTNLAAVGPRGTRHSAALGLSERCDALIVVVSEERGEVSVAEGGQLVTLGSPDTLYPRLRAFWSQKHAPPRRRPQVPWRWSEAGVIASSVALASVFWLVFAYQSEVVYRSWVAPVELRNLPAGLAIDEPPGDLRVTLEGSPQALRRLEPGDLVVRLDLSNIQPGVNALVIREADLRLPPGVRLVDVDEDVVELRARPTAGRTPARPPE